MAIPGFLWLGMPCPSCSLPVEIEYLKSTTCTNRATRLRSEARIIDNTVSATFYNCWLLLVATPIDPWAKKGFGDQVSLAFPCQQAYSHVATKDLRAQQFVATV